MPPWPMVSALAVVLAGCSSSSATSTPGSSAAQRPPAGGARTDRDRLPAAAMPPIAKSQVSLTAPVKGSIGGYRSTVTVIDAERSLPNPGSGGLIRLRGIGVLRVRCSARPRSAFALTRFAAGEGPPTVYRESVPTRSRDSISGSIGSVSGLTGRLGMRIPSSETGRQLLDRYEISGGGEAFQFAASVSALLTPTRNRCDLLAEATVVTHGPFYRYALR